MEHGCHYFMWCIQKLERVLDPRNKRFILTFDTLKSGVRVREKTWRNYVKSTFTTRIKIKIGKLLGTRKKYVSSHSPPFSNLIYESPLSSFTSIIKLSLWILLYHKAIAVSNHNNNVSLYYLQSLDLRNHSPNIITRRRSLMMSVE